MNSRPASRRHGGIRLPCVQIALLVSVLAASAVPVSAQETVSYASVSGRIIDPQGAVVGGARVTARQTETNIAREAVTERTGATVVDNSVKDLREQAEREARARLGPDRWALAYAAGRQASIDALLQDIDRVMGKG